MCFGYVNLNFEDLFYENLEMTKDKMMVKEGENMKNKYSECNVDEALEYITINKDKYCERFRALENGKRKFNFCAALFGGFGGVWQAFHFMFLEWGILILIEIMVDVGLNLIQACNFANPFIYKTVEIVNILYFVALFLFWGFFGDTLLLKSIKRKIVLAGSNSDLIVFEEFCLNSCDSKTQKIELCNLLREVDPSLSIRDISKITKIPATSVSRYLQNGGASNE